jgi:putative acetyltransferase
MRWAKNVIIRPEKPEDCDAIDSVIVAAFLTSLHAEFTEQFVVKALRNAGALAVSLIVEIDGAILGHVAISPVTISDGSPGWFGLGPLSVHPDFQGCGIGTQLMNASLDALRAMGANGCVVLGEPFYYGRFGFRVDPAMLLPDVPAEYFQAISFGPSSATGVVTYHAAVGAREEKQDCRLAVE